MFLERKEIAEVSKVRYTKPKTSDLEEEEEPKAYYEFFREDDWFCFGIFVRYPYVTGTSIVAIKYKDGVLMASDMGGSYGSTLRYKNIERVKAIGKHSLLGASGEISDFQEILRYLDELTLNDNMWDDGNSLGPKEIHNYLTRVMYNRRNKFDPLWNTLVLGGVKNGKSYLGMVSMIGVSFEDDHVATGFGNHLARPILRDEWHADLSFEDGVKLLEKCMRVLLYRDRSAINKLQIAKITEEGVTVSQPYSLKTFWEFSSFHNPTAGAEGSCWFTIKHGGFFMTFQSLDQ
uniref:Proteasome subunit beta n=1 Tax=Arabidopsis halleri subsp. halleri TaxID=81971 RepID=I0J3D8_ARAHH|nr:proteasome subunit beta type-4 [Arabidopsis halleri subsp. halleri]